MVETQAGERRMPSLRWKVPTQRTDNGSFDSDHSRRQIDKGKSRTEL